MRHRSNLQHRFIFSSTLLMLLAVLANFGCEHTAVSNQPQPVAADEESQPGQDIEKEKPKQRAKQAADEKNAGEKKTDKDRPKAAKADKEDLANPFAHRIKVPDFPKDTTWLNTGGPLRNADLKGKFVLMDFWTYCCINCIHVLPELKKLEKAYPNNLVVIGVHSAKFETEKESKNITEAILRYEIEHPVINDSDHKIWNTFGVRSWPTVLLIDPEGNAVWGRGGELKFETMDAILKEAIPYYRKRKLLDETPLRFDLHAHQQEKTPLRFPGKVLADEKGNRLFITDSNNNRIVVASLDGKLLDVIGNGAIGRANGGYDEASFDHPQGVALDGETLYVSDTENHLIRMVDLTTKTVSTIAGVGEQAHSPWPGMEKLGPLDDLPERWVGKPLETALNSPWALWVHEKNLYIAMAGPHQIWKMPLDRSEIGPFAGNGREDIVDGPLLPKQPFDLGHSSFAQPSGLASDGEWLYVADSEGSSIRAVPFDPKKDVRTVVGTSGLPFGRLFEFGDVDGPRKEVKLQHALGVVYQDKKIYVADTYNNKIKVVDAETGDTHTIAGTGKPGLDDEPAMFDEPAGITYAKGKLYVADTNNHAIRTVDLATKKVSTLVIAGLDPPSLPKKKKKPTFPGAEQIKLQAAQVKAVENRVKLNVQLDLPKGWKINTLAPMGYFVETVGDDGPVDRSKLSESLTRLAKPATIFEISLPVVKGGTDTVKVSMNYYYCQEGGEGLCKVGSVVWTVPVKIDANAKSSAISLKHKVKESLF